MHKPESIDNPAARQRRDTVAHFPLQTALVALILLAACSDFLGPELRIPVYPKALGQDTRLLRVGDSTMIHLELFLPADARRTTYQWSASAGKLIGSGLSVKFIAPATPDTVEVTARPELASTGDDDEPEPLVFTFLVYQQLILFKADDLTYEPGTLVSVGWWRFIDQVLAEKINCGIGLIGNSLESGNLAYVDLVRQLHNSNIIEIWNHGYTHVLQAVNANGQVYSEFQNTALEEQMAHIKKTQDLARDLAGIALKTFGAPGNAIDENTRAAVDAVDGLDIWLFGHARSHKMVLFRLEDFENPTSSPNFAYFLQHYDPRPDYLVLQVHPRFWDDEKFAEFGKLLDFLRSRRVTFIKPSDYHRFLGNSRGRATTPPDSLRGIHSRVRS